MRRLKCVPIERYDATDNKFVSYRIFIPNITISQIRVLHTVKTTLATFPQKPVKCRKIPRLFDFPRQQCECDAQVGPQFRHTMW